MTLIIAIATKHCTWLAVDRRLTVSRGNTTAPLPFLATKLCGLDTLDAKGFVSYAGLGATLPNGEVFEISDWIKRTLAGRSMTLSACMEQLAASATSRKLNERAGGKHAFVFVGFCGKTHTIETITSAPAMRLRSFAKPSQSISEERINLAPGVFKRWRCLGSPNNSSTLAFVGGAGEARVSATAIVKVKRCARKATNHRDKVRRVSKLLAEIIRSVASAETTVSPEVTVGVKLANGTGWLDVFDAAGHEAEGGLIVPTLANGVPVSDIAQAMLPHFLAHVRASKAAHDEGRPQPQLDEGPFREILKNLKPTNDRLP